MTVGQLISLLRALPEEAIVLVDNSSWIHDVYCAADGVTAGVFHKIVKSPNLSLIGQFVDDEQKKAAGDVSHSPTEECRAVLIR